MKRAGDVAQCKDSVFNFKHHERNKGRKEIRAEGKKGGREEGGRKDSHKLGG